MLLGGKTDNAGGLGNRLPFFDSFTKIQPSKIQGDEQEPPSVKESLITSQSDWLERLQLKREKEMNVKIMSTLGKA